MSAFRISAVSSLGILLAYLLWVPYVPGLLQENPKETTILRRRASQAAQKGKPFKPQMHWRKFSEISPNLVHAVFLAEDDTFYKHHGFDLEQILIAFRINWAKKRFAYGGSTLTQQLARTLYLSPRKSVFRKAKEAVITFWMEHTLPKKRIFELYLNAAEWGDGIFGAEAAARHYFGKSASELTAQESVALASILPSPRKWSPLKETPFMIRRRSDLMSRMRIDGYARPWSKEEKEQDRNDAFGEDEDEDESLEAGTTNAAEVIISSSPATKENLQPGDIHP